MIIFLCYSNIMRVIIVIIAKTIIVIVTITIIINYHRKLNISQINLFKQYI